jgi:hypothetical protein
MATKLLAKVTIARQADEDCLTLKQQLLMKCDWPDKLV